MQFTSPKIRKTKNYQFEPTCSYFSKILSSQQHYDWGLRDLRTVLNICGKIIKQKKILCSVDGEDILNTEFSFAMQALRTSILCKLVYPDNAKFERLLQDIFCGLQPKDYGDEILMKTVKQSFIEFGYQIDDRQVIIHLFFVKIIMYKSIVFRSTSVWNYTINLSKEWV